MKGMLQTKSTRGVVGLFCLLVMTAVFISAYSDMVRANSGIGAAPRSSIGGAFQLNLEAFATGLSIPVGLANAGDSRLFVIERFGVIKIIESDGSVLGTPFLDITARVDPTTNEEGLLGIAFHPDYANNGYFYLNYTDTTSGTRRTRISRFNVTANPNVADPNSEEIILTILQPNSNHNAGKINFGPDGYLYIPLGDGGGSGDTSNNAQTMTTLLGKVVRIDVDSGPGVSPDCVGAGTGNYTIPNSNPFIDGPNNDCDEIWALGLRNPWQSSFDRAMGDLYIGDVGQSSWEEVDFQPANSTGGENYGWRCYEGNHPFSTNGCGPTDDYTFPIFEYANSPCYSVTGGYVYRGSMYPDMVGHYIVADACSGRFWDMDTDNNFYSTLHTNLTNCCYVAFGEDFNGEIYVANIAGTIYHLTATPAVGITPTAFQYLPAVEHDF